MAIGAREALRRLRAAADDATLDEICERRGVRLLSVFGSALSSDDPGDLDIGVSFLHGNAELLGLIDDLVVLLDYDDLDVAGLDGADPVLRARALTGLGLYEREAGQFATEQMAALSHEWDTAWLRRLSLRALAG